MAELSTPTASDSSDALGGTFTLRQQQVPGWQPPKEEQPHFIALIGEVNHFIE